jgi:uncharacterized protein YbcI
MSNKTRGELEAEFTREIIKFEKNYFGRGPLDARTFFINDMILVRIKGELTQAEEKLSESKEGQELVKNARRKLFESSRNILEDMVESVVDCGLVSLHSDVSTKTGERIVVLTVDSNLTEKFR